MIGLIFRLQHAFIKFNRPVEITPVSEGTGSPSHYSFTFSQRASNEAERHPRIEYCEWLCNGTNIFSKHIHSEKEKTGWIGLVP